MKHLGDITKLNGAELPLVDILCGGSPCQDLSIAGRRAGLAGERSGLFMEQIRVIKEMRDECRRQIRMRGADEPVRPRYMVWENVNGALSSGKPKGEDFRIVLEETARIAEPGAVVPGPQIGGRWKPAGCIMGDGWSIAWRIHDAQFWGVPQRRKRIALVADFGGHTAPEILFERKGLFGDSEAGRETRQNLAANIGDGSVETGGAISFQERAGKPGGGKGILIQEEHVGALSTLNNQMVCCPNEGDPGSRMAIVIDSNNTDARYKIADDGIFQTLKCRMGTGGGNVPMVIEPVCIGNGQVDQMGLSDKAGALNCMHDQQAVLTYGLDRAAFNQGENAQYNFSIDEEVIGSQTSRGPGAVCQSVVRRLTPLECERLQGFPDGWTDIGDWVDSNGKRHKGADTPRYKALGNSIALPFWEWMAVRMLGCLGAYRPTMASLFDGIGGFPLAYSRAGCKPVWASEIEEFPIAVTKIRFPE